MHAEAAQWIADRVGELRQVRRIVEFGARNINGSVRDLVPASVPYVGVDMHPGPGVDVVCPAEAYESDGFVDLVVCAETLEHATNPEAIIARAAAILAPGGHLVMTWAGPTRAPHSGVDGGPLRPGEWYCGVPWLTAQAWCLSAGLAVQRVLDVPERGDVYLVAAKL